MSRWKIRTILLLLFAILIISVKVGTAGSLETVLLLLPNNVSNGIALHELKTSGVDINVLWELKALGPGLILETSDAASLKRIFPHALVLHDRYLPGPSIAGLGAPRSYNYNEGLNYTGKGILVAIIDTGVNDSLPWLKGKVISQYDFIDGDNDTSTRNPHGNVIASIIAGSWSNFTGVAPKAKILAYRIFGNGGFTSTALLARALERATEEGADIVNLSLGGITTRSELNPLIYRLYRKGIAVIAAVGNSGPDPGTVSYPALSWSVLGVGASLSPFARGYFPLVKLGDGTILLTPMLMAGANVTSRSVDGRLAYVVHARLTDVRDIDLRGKVAVSVRDHRTYFGVMAKNVAERGAVALLVVNDENGSFRGKILLPENPNYTSPIPVLSVSGEERDILLRAAKREDHVSISFLRRAPAQFSARGPALGLYVKPDVIAWGSMDPNPLGFNATGTSFSAPYVTGVAALLMERFGKIGPEKLYSMMKLAASPLPVPGGGLFSPIILGAGEINASVEVSRASLYIVPSYLSLFPTCSKPYKLEAKIGTLGHGGIAVLSIVGVDASVHPGRITLVPGIERTIDIRAEPTCKRSFGWLKILYDGYNYTLPMFIEPGKALVSVSGYTVNTAPGRNYTLEVIGSSMEPVQEYYSVGNVTLRDVGPGYCAVLAYTASSLKPVGKMLTYIAVPLSGRPGFALAGPPVETYVVVLITIVLSAALALLALALDKLLAKRITRARNIRADRRI